MSVVPRLYACWFGSGAEDQWPRLARVLDYSARRQAPAWRVDVERIDPGPPGNRTAAFEANTRKLDRWAAIVAAAHDGERLVLIDADTMVLRPIDPVWDLEFDVAYTVRPAGTRLPFNAGVIILRVSPAVRTFVSRWAAENRRMLLDQARHAQYYRRYGGINQAALGALFDEGAAAGLRVARLECREWNCEDSTWSRYDGTTRIVHVKSGLRRTCFGLAPSPGLRHLAPIARVWRTLEREAQAVARPLAVAALPAPSPARVVPGVPALLRRRGRPRVRPAGVVYPVKLSCETYDAYCRAANRTGASIHKLLVKAIDARAPR